MNLNSCIPVSIPHFQEYLLRNFKININEIPLEDWSFLIYNNYCNNIIDNKLCLKKHKKIINLNTDNKYLCSKCCERKGIKRNPIYKKTKVKKVKENNNKEESVNCVTQSPAIRFCNKLESTKIEKIEVLENYDIKNKSKIYITDEKDKYVNNNCIKFGDLDFNLDNKYRYLINNLYKNKLEKLKDGNHYIDNENIMFGSLKIDINNKKEIIENICSLNSKTNNKSIKDNTSLNIPCSIYLANKKEDELLNSDIYYIFVYLVNLIFYNYEIAFIKNELYNCLGSFGINFYISQLNSF